MGTLIGAKPWHPSNHWGSADMGSRLALADADYGALYAGSTLEVNDISLEWGGVFDIDQNWVPDHVSHRWGDNVDVRLVPIARRPHLRKIPRRVRFAIYEHGLPNPHYHLTVQ